MILAGDIGGTKCNMALIEPRGGAFEVVFLQRYPSQNFADFSDLLKAFLGDASETLEKSGAKVQAAGFGVAGPVIGQSAHLTNLGWNLERTAIERQLGTPHVALLNDLEATGYSLAWLAPEEFCVLNGGIPSPQANCALIAAGTGLGESILRWSGGRYIVEAGEGGHCDLAPRTDREIELLRYMKKTPGPVSFEMILSGRGFYTVHQFLAPALRHPSFEQDAAAAAPEITRLAPCRQLPGLRRDARLVDGAVWRGSGQSGAEGFGAGRSLRGGRHRAENSAENEGWNVPARLLRKVQIRGDAFAGSPFRWC